MCLLRHRYFWYRSRKRFKPTWCRERENININWLTSSHQREYKLYVVVYTVASDDGQLWRRFWLESRDRFMFTQWQRTRCSARSSTSSTSFQIVVSSWFSWCRGQCAAADEHRWSSLHDDDRPHSASRLVSATVRRWSRKRSYQRPARTTRQWCLLSSSGGCGGVNRWNLLGSSIWRETGRRPDAVLADCGCCGCRLQSAEHDAKLPFACRQPGQCDVDAVQPCLGRVVVVRNDEAGSTDWRTQSRQNSRDSRQFRVSIVRQWSASGPITC